MQLERAKGCRDFDPGEKILRDQIISTLKTIFERYGYSPIETPILERYDVLAAKFAAGEESDALRETFTLTDQGKRELGLRYDLTVPFCRYVGMNPQMKMPFKKYMYGDVFRDGPLKLGRYREFFQVDPDIVGVKSMIADAEILAIVHGVFLALEIDVTIRLNDRRILDGVLETVGIGENKRMDAIIAIDKLDKKSVEEVKKELSEKGVTSKQVDLALKALQSSAKNEKKLAALKAMMKSKIGDEGVTAMSELLHFCQLFGVTNINFDPVLARGLSYYTGPVFEVWLVDKKINSSLAGGGRYDKMIGDYLGSNKEYPATGVSFGIEPIIEYMKLQEKARPHCVSTVYVIPIGTLEKTIPIVQELRSARVNADMDLLGRGISKNLDYANALKIPFVLFVGERELAEGKLKLKNMREGSEEHLTISQVIEKLKSSDSQ